MAVHTVSLQRLGNQMHFGFHRSVAVNAYIAYARSYTAGVKPVAFLMQSADILRRRELQPNAYSSLCINTLGTDLSFLQPFHRSGYQAPHVLIRAPVGNTASESRLVSSES